MHAPPLQERLLTVAGLATWLLVGIPLLSCANRWSATVAWVLFGVAYVACRRLPRNTSVLLALLSIQSLAALVLLVVAPAASAPVLLVVVAGEAGFYLESAIALSLGASQLLAHLGVVFYFGSLREGLTAAGMYGGFQAFALGASRLAKREREGRMALMQAHTTLAATQAELGESQRAGERARMARELHDRVGHHLVALSLNLELAQRSEPTASKAALAVCRSISAELLADVRGVVAEIGHDPDFSLENALRLMAERIPMPKVEVTAEFGLDVLSADRAIALFRVAQEGVTNAAKHASASRVWVGCGVLDGVAWLRVTDDGRGVVETTQGFGLKGLQSRLRAFGGEIELHSTDGAGVTLTARIPMSEPK